MGKKPRLRIGERAKKRVNKNADKDADNKEKDTKDKDICKHCGQKLGNGHTKGFCNAQKSLNDFFFDR